MDLESSLSRLLPGLEELWAESQGEPEVVVAVVDGPVDRSHPALRNAHLRVIETLVTPAAGAGAATDHGTHVASLIFGAPESPVRGLAPGVSGLLLPVFGEREDGTVRLCSQLDLARAITLAVTHGAQVVVVSAGQLAAGGEANHHLAQAVALCAASNVLLVAAVGNDGCECLHVPAALPAVLAVGAVDAGGLPLASNNHGGVYALQGVVAPGEEIVGAVSGGRLAAKSGASVATAVVAGVAALLLSIERLRGRRPDPHGVRRALLSGALPCDFGDPTLCNPFLKGRLDVRGALAELALRSEPAGGLPDDRSPSGSGGVAPANRRTLRGGKSMETEPEVEEMEALGFSPDLPETSVGGGAVAPSDCGCGCGGGKREAAATCGCKKETAPSATPSSRSLVYALGVIGYDFGSEARRDSFIQSGVAHPGNPEELLAHLDANPEAAAALKWTLSQDSTVLYAIAPAGPFAIAAYARLREFLAEQLRNGVELVSVPGRIAGKTTLQNGQTVPTILPELRGMYSWTTGRLVEAVSGAGATADDVRNFLQRVYYEIRNLGLAPQERALNFAATNAFQVERVFAAALGSGLKLDAIDVERSPVCRPSSDCWDVKLSFFNPSRRLEQARQVHRFTIDVSDVIPVTVGAIRSWDVY